MTSLFLPGPVPGAWYSRDKFLQPYSSLREKMLKKGGSGAKFLKAVKEADSYCSRPRPSSAPYLESLPATPGVKISALAAPKKGLSAPPDLCKKTKQSTAAAPGTAVTSDERAPLAFSSKYVGVCWDGKLQLWSANIHDRAWNPTPNSKKFLGSFMSEEVRRITEL